MSTLLVVSLLTASGLIGVFWTLMALARRNAALLDQAAVATDRESFSDYYRPMLHLLDARDLATASSLQGVSALDFADFRRDRLAAFRSYLKDMRSDFNRIEFKIRYMMLSAQESDADLVLRLNRLKANFQSQLLRVELQLILFRFGFTALRVEVAPLVEALEQFDQILFPRHALAASASR